MKALPWALVALVAVLALGQARCAGEREGALRSQLAALDRRNAQLEEEAGRVDSIFIRDTVNLTRIRVRTDSILAVDTLLRVDTVRLLLAGERAACDGAIATCVTRIAVRDSIIALRDSMLTLERKRRPGRFGCVVGPTVTDKGFGVGGSCGFRITK